MKRKQMASARAKKREADRAVAKARARMLRDAERVRDALVQAAGPRCAAKVVWQIRRELHVHGYKDLFIPDGPEVPIEFLAAFDCLRRRRGWRVEDVIGPEGRRRSWRVTWLGSKVHQMRARAPDPGARKLAFLNPMDAMVHAMRGAGHKVHG